MNRIEIVLTLVGLGATFLMPWPGQESVSGAELPAVRAEAAHGSCVAAPTASAESDHRIAPGRTASERLPGRG